MRGQYRVCGYLRDGIIFRLAFCKLRYAHAESAAGLRPALIGLLEVGATGIKRSGQR